MARGILLILSGPSGVGKDTVIDAWKQRDPSVVRVVACTTRDPRPGEDNGVAYHFLTPEEFQTRVAQNRFLEYKEVHGNWYATPLDQVEDLLAQGKVALLKIDVQGALEVMEKRPDAVTVFLLPPDMQELERRLTDRSTESPENLAKRLQNARDEIALAPRYQHQVVNDDLDQAVKSLIRIKESACRTLS